MKPRFVLFLVVTVVAALVASSLFMRVRQGVPDAMLNLTHIYYRPPLRDRLARTLKQMEQYGETAGYSRTAQMPQSPVPDKVVEVPGFDKPVSFPGTMSNEAISLVIRNQM